MDSIRNQIFNAIKATLLGVEGIRAVNRGKLDPLSVISFPVANIVPGFDPVSEEVNTLVTRDLQVFVVLYVASQRDILESVETILAKVQMAMSQDHTLGGVVIDCTETAAAEVFPANATESVAGVVLEYRVIYRTLRNNPYSRG